MIRYMCLGEHRSLSHPARLHVPSVYVIRQWRRALLYVDMFSAIRAYCAISMSLLKMRMAATTRC